jgi:hypothetical protein
MLLGATRLRRFSDVPLALLIGTPAKRAKEIGAPSLKHPFARVFPLSLPLRRWRTKSGKDAASADESRRSETKTEFSQRRNQMGTLFQDRNASGSSFSSALIDRQLGIIKSRTATNSSSCIR